MKIEGIIPPVVTLFKKNNEIDEQATRNHLDFLIENGVHGIFSLSSTGEFAYLSDEEKKQIMKITVDHVNGRVPVIAGISSPSTKQSIAWGKYAEDIGADFAMAILSAYFPVSDKDVFNFFEELSNKINLPLFLYNFPTVINYDVKVATVQKLAEEGLIIGIKETVFDIEHVRNVLKAVNDPNFIVLVGIDTLFKEGLELGIKGAILGTSNFAPKIHSQLYNAFKNKDEKNFNELLPKFNQIITTVLRHAASAQYSVSLTKEVMEILGHNIETIVRSPLPSISDKLKIKLIKILSQAKIE